MPDLRAMITGDLIDPRADLDLRDQVGGCWGPVVWIRVAEPGHHRA